jgi:UDPglucose 6-dehydrogenase
VRVASDWDRVCRARRWSVSAETGNDVACVDVNAAKIEALGQNKIPIYEPGLEELVERNQSQQRLQFTTDVARPIGGAEVAFIAVGTPPDEDGAADFTHVLAVAETTIIDGLLAAGVTVVAHDPAAMPQSRRRLGDRIWYADSNYDALDGADALVIVADWNEYRHPDFNRMMQTLRRPVIIDGRNLHNPDRLRSLGFVYDSIRAPLAESVAKV